MSAIYITNLFISADKFLDGTLKYATDTSFHSLFNSAFVAILQFDVTLVTKISSRVYSKVCHMDVSFEIFLNKILESIHATCLFSWAVLVLWHVQ
jgi:hypothetical protein